MDIFGAFCLLGKIQFKLCAGMEKNREIFNSDQLNQFQHRLVTLKYLKNTHTHTQNKQIYVFLGHKIFMFREKLTFCVFWKKKKCYTPVLSIMHYSKQRKSRNRGRGPKKNIRWPSSFNQAKGYVTNRLKCYRLWQQLANEKKQKQPFTVYLPLGE